MISFSKCREISRNQQKRELSLALTVCELRRYKVYETMYEFNQNYCPRSDVLKGKGHHFFSCKGLQGAYLDFFKYSQTSEIAVIFELYSQFYFSNFEAKIRLFLRNSHSPQEMSLLKGSIIFSFSFLSALCGNSAACC